MKYKIIVWGQGKLRQQLHNSFSWLHCYWPESVGRTLLRIRKVSHLRRRLCHWSPLAFPTPDHTSREAQQQLFFSAQNGWHPLAPGCVELHFYGLVWRERTNIFSISSNLALMTLKVLPGFEQQSKVWRTPFYPEVGFLLLTASWWWQTILSCPCCSVNTSCACLMTLCWNALWANKQRKREKNWSATAARLVLVVEIIMICDLSQIVNLRVTNNTLSSSTSVLLCASQIWPDGR